ncbi:hypothetical protein PPERSA_09683 [Pseudocohnilembus persalinus]|uniref:Uncharacterized protein n=1 Tax=Pseudocohnilembus persalinus TaxID=266149 RepID=A0A0V0R758_PSEPJ|nr:hypothetical protein PPERSA_09683 [Pseudocohnilembus persalinus]|eukprot:KRX10299.1 hypothetical protein PPERSA_09683 [Pseudocohnilembus persalinus]
MKIIEDIIEEVNQEIKTKAPYAMRKYQKINSTIRDSLIHKIIQEDKSIKQAAQEVNINYSSAKSILNQYRKKKGAQTTNSTENQIRQQEHETDSQQTFDNEHKELQNFFSEPQQQIGSKTVSIENFTSLNKSLNLKPSPKTLDVSVEISNNNKIQKENFKQEQKKPQSLNLPQLPALVHKKTENKITSKQNYNKILDFVSFPKFEGEIMKEE